MLFMTVAQAFDVIYSVTARLKMTEYLADLYKQTTPHEASILSYLSLGLLRASYKGNQFNFSDKGLIKVLAMVFDVSEQEILQEAKRIGDLGALVETKPWPGKDRGLSLTDVHRRLEEFEALSGTGSQEKKNNALQTLLLDLDGISAKYVIRIINGTMRMGFSDMTLIDALSWMAVGNKSYRAKLEYAYNICADIGLIAEILKRDGITAIKAMKIHIGIPIRPAAAERLNSPEAIMEKLGPCVAQPKIDGFRLQIHLNKEVEPPLIKFFSRNLLDMTAMFPDLRKQFLSVAAHQIICEGEAVAYNENTGEFVPFQETVKRRRKHGIAQAMEDLPLKVFLFDILYLNGESLLDKKHEERRKILLKLFDTVSKDRIEIIPERSISNADQLEKYFLESIGKGLEGLVVKRPDALYQPGKRNFNWIKLKRHQEGTLEDTLDCVILGYYAGAGKRASFGVGAFLVGAFNKEQDSFQTIAKVGTGLTDEEWKELKLKCDRIKVDHKPAMVDCSSDLNPDVWVMPDIVCLIRADEITLSPVHTAGKVGKQEGYALRFPRFMGYRPDKSAQDATTVSEIQELYEDQFARKKK